MRDMVGDKFVQDSFDELMYDILTAMMDPDFVCEPRGSEVKEILVPRLVLSCPRNRLLTNAKRHAKYGFGVGEFLWYWRGSNSLEEMTYYNKRMPGFSDDGKTVNSAYGHIIKGKGRLHVNQWQIAINTLIDDEDSRRAVLQIHHPIHQLIADRSGSKDVPCTLSLQFFIREDKLHLHVHMRSNDVHWGLTYDLFSFTLFQECMLLELRKHYLGLEMGRYIHTAGSLHVYKRHYKMSQEMVDEHAAKYSKFQREWGDGRYRFTEPMVPLDTLEDLDRLMEFEARLRIGKPGCRSDVHPFKNMTVAWMAEQLMDHREKRDKESV